MPPVCHKPVHCPDSFACSAPNLPQHAVSLYTLTVTLMNCFMPYLGVQLYTVMGSDYRALMLFNAIVFVARTATFLLLLWRCKYVTKE